MALTWDVTCMTCGNRFQIYDDEAFAITEGKHSGPYCSDACVPENPKGFGEVLEEVQRGYQQGVREEAAELTLQQAAQRVVDSWMRSDDFASLEEHIEILEIVLANIEDLPKT